jgi:hypothetical protein
MIDHRAEQSPSNKFYTAEAEAEEEARKEELVVD